jgi:hypothetical protein
MSVMDRKIDELISDTRQEAIKFISVLCDVMKLRLGSKQILQFLSLD